MEKKEVFREKVSPIRQWMMMFFAHLYTGNVHYIGGADPLPQPLTPEELLQKQRSSVLPEVFISLLLITLIPSSSITNSITARRI